MYKLHLVTPFVGCYEFTKNYLKSIRSSIPFSLKLIDNKPSTGIFEVFIQEYNEIFKDLNSNGYCEVLYLKNDATPRGVAESWNQGIVESLKDPDCQYIFIPNNDVLLSPFLIDKLIEFIDISGCQFVTASNVNDGNNYPENVLLATFSEHDLRNRNNWAEEGPDFSCFMLTPKVIKEVGFFDENFKPAYFEDNDYHRRMNVAGIKCARSLSIPYWHFSSRTLQEESNKELREQFDKEHFFDNSRRYFQAKWGGPINKVMNNECYMTPFDNPDLKPYMWRGYEKFEIIRQGIK